MPFTPAEQSTLERALKLLQRRLDALNSERAETSVRLQSLDDQLVWVRKTRYGLARLLPEEG